MMNFIGCQYKEEKMNFLLDLERKMERNSKKLSKEKDYKNKVLPSSNISVFCTNQNLSKADVFDVLAELLK